MSRQIAVLLAATAIAACSSDPQPAAERLPSSASLIREYDVPPPVADVIEQALAEAPPTTDLPPLAAPPPLAVQPRASEPPYPHPGAPPVMRRQVSGACDIDVERSRGRIVLTALADPDRSMSGDYSFIITKSGGGNSSDIEQGGPFRAAGNGPVELSSSEISLERGSSYRATLTLTSRGREVCRRVVRS